MRPGLSVPLWHRLSCASPCYRASATNGSLWRTVKSNDHHLWFCYQSSSLLLPCCSTVLQQNRLLHTASPSHQKRRSFFGYNPEQMPIPHANIRRPQKVYSSLGRDDMALDKTLELIKQATAFLQKEKNSPLHETPTSIIPSHSNTKQTHTSAMEPDMPPKGALLKHRGRGTRKGSQTPDFISNSPIASESPEHGVQVESSSLASSINGVSPTINEEPLKSTQASMYSTTRASHDAVAKSVPLWNPYARHVPRTGAEQLQQMQAPVVSPPNSRLLRIALLGLPNAGKSTLINALLEDRVCSVSNKPNSTRCLARAIYTTDDTQLVFLDTPGIVTPEQTIKHRLFGSVVQDAERSLAQADLLLLLHDCSSPFNRLGIHPRLLRVLALYPHIPAMLVMNKVDLVKPKQHLLKVTRMLTEGVVGGRPSHHDTIPSGPRDPFKDVTRDPDMLVKSFLDTLERKNNKVPEEEEEEEHRSAEDELDEPDALIPATQSTQQVTFDQLINGVNAVVLPNLDIASKFHVKTSVSDEDVLSGRVKLSEQQLAAFIEGRKGWPYFERVLLTSALKSDGVMALRQVLEDSAVPAPWQYPASMITDQDPYQMATLTVREKFMDKFKYQLPYNLRFEVDNWKIGDADSLIVRIRVICQEEGLIKLLVGASGCHVKTICQQAEQKLGQIFKADVRLQLIVSAEGKSHKVEDTQINKKAREQS